MPFPVPKWWPFAAIGLLVVAILSLTYCSGKTAGKSGEVVKQQEREIDTQHDLGNANDAAAGQRVEDAIRLTDQQRELDNAEKSGDDADKRRISRGCVILRQQGRNLQDIPACR